jgi:uncharacterized metal-binding protein
VASGRTHENINLVALGLVIAAYVFARFLYQPYSLENALPRAARMTFLVSYLVGTFLVTPDLDLAKNSVRAKNNWGLLGLLWVPYGKLFRHRGLSHSWILGPLTRLLYMGLIALLFIVVTMTLTSYLGYELHIVARLGQSWGPLYMGALGGYYLSQWLHLVADGVRPG